MLDFIKAFMILFIINEIIVDRGIMMFDNRYMPIKEGYLW